MENVSTNLDTNSLILDITSYSDGELTIKIPRSLIDSKNNDMDSNFFVLLDSVETTFQEKITKNDRELLIPFFTGTREIEIIGTQIGNKILKPVKIVKILPGSSVPREDEKYLTPQTLVIEKGQVVTWENCDERAHTITSGTPENGSSGEFDSGLMMTGATYEVTLTKKEHIAIFV